MPRHQTSRELDASEDHQADKLAVFRKYAQISAEIQEYGSAALGALEGISPFSKASLTLLTSL